jgi:hypothetical protein
MQRYEKTGYGEKRKLQGVSAFGMKQKASATLRVTEAVFLWSWRDSNPRPDKVLRNFLHA